MYDAIIIGGGYAGLTCGVRLAKAGWHVCVVEKGRTFGGAFQTFRRGALTFDTGFHFVGGVAEGEMLHPSLVEFGLDDLPWHRMDEEFIEVHCGSDVYHLHCGYDRFAEGLATQFGNEGEGIDALVGLMRDVADHLPETVVADGGYENQLMQVPAKKWLEEHIGDSRLRNLLCAQAVTTDLTPDLPLYSFIQSLNSFVQHSYRLPGGGGAITARLRHNIEALGGEVRTGCEVQKLIDDGNGRILSARCANGDILSANLFISTAHPALSVGLMPECPQVRGVYRRRFARMKNSRGIFTVQLALKPGTVPYRNKAISLLGDQDLWDSDYSATAPVKNLLINYNVPQNHTDDEPLYADNVDLMTPMDYSAVEPWADSYVGHRPAGYQAFKETKARECIELASGCIPNLKESIVAVYTSSPLTYRDYTGTVGGSAYGVSKSASAIAGGMLSPLTPFANLLFAGQSLMLHGMLGVGMTSMLVTNIAQKM